MGNEDRCGLTTNVYSEEGHIYASTCGRGFICACARNVLSLSYNITEVFSSIDKWASWFIFMIAQIAQHAHAHRHTKRDTKDE